MATTAGSAPAAPVLRSAGYQTLLVGLLSLNFGIVFFDRQALNVLMPFVQPELSLSQTQIGIIAGGLSFTWAIAAFGVGKLSDTLGRRKLLLVLSTIAFSFCSVLTGIASSFALLLGARLLMGVAEGGVMPISHAMVATEVSRERRGLAQGVAQNLGSNLLGSFLAPVVLITFAQVFGWREAFYLAGVPGIVSAILIWFILEEPAAPAKPVHAERMTILEAMKIRNIWICVVVGVLMVAHFVITWAFLPLFLAQQRGMDADTLKWVTGSLGVAAAIYSFAVSGLSDKIGRKPVMVFLPFLSVVGPLAVLFLDPGAFDGLAINPVSWLSLSGYGVVLIPLFFIGWMVNGIFPIFMATIPSETVDPRFHATVLGLAMGSCEILGGVFGPPAAGALNDAFGASTFLWVLMILGVLSGFVAMGLRETAPSQVSKRAAV